METKDRPYLFCFGCKKTPDELPEYFKDYTGSVLDPKDYVWQEEGTLNRTNGHFLCTQCYVKAGMPTADKGWQAP